jgi:hypothetical protein
LYWEVPVSSSPQWGSLAATPTLSGIPIVATFSGPSANPNDYSISIDWGDATPIASGSVLSDGDGGFWALGAHTYLAAGAYSISVAIADLDGAGAPAQSIAFVLNDLLTFVPTAISAVEGLPMSGSVGSFTGPSPRATSYTASIDWGDGTTSAGRVTRGAAPGFDVLGFHVYAGEGAFTIEVSVSYLGESGSEPPQQSSGSSTATVSDAPLTGSDGGTFQAFLAVPFTGAVGAFGDADPYGTWGDYAATIDWGDGQGASAADRIAPVDGGFAVIGSHTYLHLGQFPVGIAIIDGAGSATFAASTAVVVPAPDAGPQPDAGSGDAGLTWLLGDAGAFLFDAGRPTAAEGCGCRSEPGFAFPGGLALGVAFVLAWRSARRRAQQPIKVGRDLGVR